MKKLFAFFFALSLPWCSAARAETPPFGVVLQQAVAAYAQVNDYTCWFARKELLSNGKIHEHTTVFFKFMKPGRFYMHWPNDWIEAIYAEGRYDNKMMIEGGKLFSFLSMGVDPARALKYNRHTIKEAGIGHVLELIGENYRQVQSDHDASIVFEKEDVVGGRPTWRYQGTFPTGHGYYGHTIHLDFDQQSHLPVRIEVLGWQNEFLEAYAFTDLKLNVGLGEADFDVNNPAYHFGKGVPQ